MRCAVALAALVVGACGHAASDASVGSESTGATVCGNGIVEGDEECDGLDLVGEDCTTRGFASGILRCSECSLDASECTNCGNGVLDADEPCDGERSNGQTCATEGFFAGDLACTPTCELDTSRCHECGDAVIDDDEICEAGQLGAHTCASLGHGDGELACGVDCRSFETSACAELVCDRDPDASASDECPTVCTSCTAGACNIDCLGNSGCSSSTIECPAGRACNVTCDGHSACSSTTIRCPAHWSCAVSCSDPAACTSMTIACSDDGTCTLACGAGGGGLCAGATLQCGRDSCTATCEDETDVDVQCDEACACTGC